MVNVHVYVLTSPIGSHRESLAGADVDAVADMVNALTDRMRSVFMRISPAVLRPAAPLKSRGDEGDRR